MTFALLQEPRVHPGERARAAALLRERVEHAFRPAASSGTMVGLELELIPVRVEGTRRHPLRLEVASELFGADPILASQAAISFEPGGQLELSLPPHAGVASVVATAQHLVSRARHIAAAAHVELLLEGTNPHHTADEVGLQMVKPRYIAMQKHFDRLGPSGRRMMRQTASLQVCLDVGAAPREVGERWRVANLAGPALLAAYANSPRIERMRSGAVSTRSAIWQQTDARRTGFDGAQLTGADAYSAFALDATVFGLPSAQPWTRNSTASTMRTLMSDHGVTAADVDHHLSTLFPPVRPRGYLEIRYLDALDGADLVGAVSALWLLVCDADARAAALQILERPAGMSSQPGWRASWWAAATRGVRDAALRRTAVALLDVAAGAARRNAAALPPHAATALRAHRDRAAAGRCPGDFIGRARGT